MIKNRAVIASSLWLTSLTLAADGALVLVHDEKPAAVILLADRPTSAARHGATVIQTWLRRISGATVPIERESRRQEAEDRVVILCIARLAAEKNHAMLLRSCGRLRDRGADFCLVLVGHGELESRLRVLSAELRLDDRVYFVGGTDQPIDAYSLYSGYGSNYAVNIVPRNWSSQAGTTYRVQVAGTSIDYEVTMVDCDQ